MKGGKVKLEMTRTTLDAEVLTTFVNGDWLFDVRRFAQVKG